MLDLIKPKNLVLQGGGKAVEKLFTLLVGIAPQTYLKGVEAQAQAKLIEAKKKVEIRELLAEAEREHQLREQGRLISIIDQAAPQLTHDVEPDNIDKDWRENFRAKARHVTTDDMQAFWGRLLATETNNPGTVSKRAVNAVADMDRKDAELFTRLCGIIWETPGGRKHILIYDYRHSIYESAGLTLTALQSVQSMGLVGMSSVGFNIPIERDGHLVLLHGGRVVRVPVKREQNFSLGRVVLTDIGQQIAAVVDSQPLSGFYEYCRDKWKAEESAT